MFSFIGKNNREKLFWILHVTGWILFAIAMKFYYSERIVDSVVSFYRFYVTYFIGFALTSVLRFFYRKVFRRIKTIPGIIGIIILSSTICLIIWEPLDLLVSLPFWTEKELTDFFSTYKPYTILKYYKMNIFWFFIILIWSVLYFGIKFWKDLLIAKQHSEKTLLLAQKSQLQMLRYQLNPHFLFNSLNSIQALVYENPEHADKMITELSEFLRFTLRDKDKLFIPLGEEVNIIEKYLSMEKTRFPDRLDYKISVTQQASNIEVIAFILQPFVENAVKHGLKSSPEKLFITVQAFSDNQNLYLKIKNTGHWIDNNDNKGIGIKNVYDRLKMAYPDKYNLNIDKNINSVCVLIKINIQ